MGNPNGSHVRGKKNNDAFIIRHTQKEILIKPTPCLLSVWAAVSPSGYVCFCVCGCVFRNDVFESVGIQASDVNTFGYYSTKGSVKLTNTRFYPGGIGPWEEERNPLTQTKTESGSHNLPLDKPFLQYIWWILSFPLIRSCYCCVRACVHAYGVV